MSYLYPPLPPSADAGTVVTPATIAVVAALPTPAVVAASVVAPTVIAAVVTVPTPTVLAAAKVTPAVISTVVTLPTPTVLAAAKVTPTVVAVVVALPTPTVLAAALVTPAVIPVVTTLPTPSILAAALVTPAVIPLLVALPTPTIVAGSYPVVASLTQSVFNTADTSHLVAMPATVDVGDLLTVTFVNTVATVTLPSGWAELHSTLNGAPRLSNYYKIADGTEDGTTVDFVTSTARTATAHVYRITGWHGTTPPEIGTAATGNSTLPDPPTLSPSWGSGDGLWLSTIAANGAVTVSVYPTSYTDGADDNTTGANNSSIATARRNLTAASDDPSTFTISSSVTWVAQTIGIRSGGAAPATVTPATVALLVALPTPSIAAGALVTPTVIPVVTTLPTPTILAASKVTPTVIAAVAALPTPTILAAARVTPSTIAVLVALPTPTINVASGPITVTPAGIALLVALPTPGILAAALVTPATITVIVALPAPQAFAGAQIFWVVNPVGYTLNPAAFTLNPAAYVKVGPGDDPPW